MRNPARLDEHTAFLADFAEGYLSGRTREVDVRPLTFEDIAALASGAAPQTFAAFRADETGALTPVIVTVTYHRDTPSVNTTYAINPVNSRLDRSAPVGARIRVSFEDGYGRTSSNNFLFTTEEAEEESGFGTSQDPGRIRLSIFLPEGSGLDEHSVDRDVFHATQTERRPLAAVHGSEVSLSCVIAGIAPDVLAERVRAIIESEFGQAVGAIVNVHTHAVSPERVDVFGAESGKPLAINVLAAESSYLMGKSESGLIETRSAQHNGLIVGR